MGRVPGVSDRSERQCAVAFAAAERRRTGRRHDAADLVQAAHAEGGARGCPRKVGPLPGGEVRGEREPPVRAGREVVRGGRVRPGLTSISATTPAKNLQSKKESTVPNVLKAKLYDRLSPIASTARAACPGLEPNDRFRQRSSARRSALVDPTRTVESLRSRHSTVRMRGRRAWRGDGVVTATALRADVTPVRRAHSCNPKTLGLRLSVAG